VDSTQEKETSLETLREPNIRLKDFKVAVITMLKEQKEFMFKEMKESMMAVTHQMENTNK
jgi:hypothetical protein